MFIVVIIKSFYISKGYHKVIINNINNIITYAGSSCDPGPPGGFVAHCAAEPETWCWDPGLDPGLVDPGLDPGLGDPGLGDAGLDPGLVDSGLDPGLVDSGLDPGLGDPGLGDPGLNPGLGDHGLVDSGLDPGLVDPGLVDPGLNPGLDPGLNPGLDPGLDPGLGDSGLGDSGMRVGCRAQGLPGLVVVAGAGQHRRLWRTGPRDEGGLPDRRDPHSRAGGN